MQSAFKYTMKSGSKFENIVVNVIQNYTNAIWHNIRVETLLTKQGTTEIDILFCYKNIVFIIEVKNVSSIIGAYGDKIWSFVGSTTPNKETRSYTALNIITQNNIHVRSFKDLFYANYTEWVKVIPIIVVPNDCKVSSDISGAIHTISQFDALLADISAVSVTSKIQRRVAAMIPCDNATVLRPDFYLDNSLNKRIKRVVK